MSDLIERLRGAAALPNGLYAEAADALTELQARLAVVRNEALEEAAKEVETFATDHRFDIAGAIRALKETEHD